jgi:hypothetical protein
MCWVEHGRVAWRCESIPPDHNKVKDNTKPTGLTCVQTTLDQSKLAALRTALELGISWQIHITALHIAFSLTRARAQVQYVKTAGAIHIQGLRVVPAGGNIAAWE